LKNKVKLATHRKKEDPKKKEAKEKKLEESMTPKAEKDLPSGLG